MLEHLAELKLRRLRAGELLGQDGETARTHLAGCLECTARVKALDAEDAQFQATIPFEQFAAGVARAQRRPIVRPVQVLTPVLAIAAAVLLTVALRPVISGTEVAANDLSTRSRIKGDRSKRGAEIELRIAGPTGHPQREAAVSSPEVLSTGERVRIGYKAGEYRYLVSVSVDEEGVVTPLYPEGGESLPISEDGATHYLPDSLEFTGRGAERVIVVLTDEPLPVDEVKRAAKVAYDAARGDVLRMPELAVPGGQFHQTLLKP